MFSSKKKYEENPKQQLCINKETDFVSYQQEQETKQNSNYPPQPQSQQYQQSSYHNNPQLQTQQISQTSQQLQNQMQVKVIPVGSQSNYENSELNNVGQKRAFTVIVVTLWMVQITIEVIIYIKIGIYVTAGLIYPCFFIALMIMLYTVYDSYPINKLNKVRFMDQILLIIYFIADIFVIFCIFFTINQDGINIILAITRACQGINLLCALIPLLKTANQINTKEILLLTLIPFVLMILFTRIMNEWFRAGSVIYLIPIVQQVFQVCETFNLVRVINEIYSKKNHKIDINNIYTGFILFKYSYYIPC